MKKQILAAICAVAFLGLASCSPTASQIQKTLEENPEALFAVIEKHPAKFFETVRKAQLAAQESGQTEQLKGEVKRAIAELQTPKKPAIDSARVLGSASAPITIVEYSDYNCGHCSHAAETIKKVKADFGDKVRFIFKQYPVLDKKTHTSMLAAEYSEAVAMQSADLKNAFHETVFAGQAELQEKGEEFLKSAVKAVGADLAKVQKDRKSKTVKDRIQADSDEAKSFGFEGTPAFLVNGASLPGAYPYEAFKQIIEHILVANADQPAPPAETKN